MLSGMAGFNPRPATSAVASRRYDGRLASRLAGLFQSSTGDVGGRKGGTAYLGE